ncbi:hypothetical protein FI667_g5183, partial [Globisporangium splendens]
MARVKQEWKAQMRHKLQASMAQKALEEVAAALPAPVAVEMVAPPVVRTEISPSSVNCIDLTFDDDSDEDDEPLGSAAANAVAASVPSQQPPLTEQKTATQSLPEVLETVESDVDEEWPQAQDKTPNERVAATVEHETKVESQAPTAQIPVAFNASAGIDEEHESEEDEELPKRAVVASATQAADTKAPAVAQPTDISGNGAPNVETSAPAATAHATSAPETTVAMDVEMAEASDTTSSEAQIESTDGTLTMNVETVEASDATSELQQESVEEGSTLDPDDAADLSQQQEPTPSAPLAVATPRRDKDVDDEENLEDGEIFEEGAVITSPTQVKQAIAAERLARAGDSDASGGSPQQPLRQKKQKKRGKKKSKRKLDAMLMMSGGVPEFDRNTRHHPFPLPPDAPPRPLGEHPHSMADIDHRMMMYGGPPPGFGDHLHAPPPSALPRPPPPPQRRGSPFGPFADDQILRVNRHGNVAMFNPNGVEYSRPGMSSMPPPQAPQSMFAGGFKYRNIGDRLWNAETTSSTASSSNQSPESFQGNAASTKEQGDLGGRSRKQSDVDLDSLRAAALRTKRMLRQQENQQEADAAKKSGDEVVSFPETEVREDAKAPQEATSLEEAPPDIEALRVEILRSMMKKKKATTSASAAVLVATESSAPSNNAEPDVSAEVAGGALAVIDDAVAPSEADDHMAKDMTPEAASAKSAESVVAEQEKVVEHENVAEKDSVAASTCSLFSSLPVTPAVPITTTIDAIATPKFRPLTASSQSIVIRLSPEDYMKSSKASDVIGNGSSEGANAANDGALMIQSAIEEMRKQIAEKEKLRRASRPEVAVVSSVGSLEASAVPLVSTNGTVASGVDGVSTPDSLSQPPTSSQQQKATTPTIKNAATRSSLQAKIDEMKKRIAAKEREKKSHSANSNTVNSNSASTTTPSSSASSSSSNSSSSPRDRLKDGEATRLDSNVANENDASPAPPAASTEPNGAANGPSSAEEPVPAIAKDKPTLEEYRTQYERCATDYEAATRQVATLDDAIAKLRDQIAALEPPASIASS